MSCAAFDAWLAVAHNFAQCGQLEKVKRVQLLMKPVFHALTLHSESAVHKVRTALQTKP